MAGPFRSHLCVMGAWSLAAASVVFAPGCTRSSAPTGTTRGPVLPSASAVPLKLPQSASSSFPTGHWEGSNRNGADSACLTIYPFGGFRFVVPALGHRNPARVTGHIVASTSVAADRAWELTLEVDRIVASELGPCRKSWIDRDLAEATILGCRLAPVSAERHTHETRTADAAFPPAHPRFALKFVGESVAPDLELCALDDPSRLAASRCRTLARQSLTHTTAAAWNDYGCKEDADCATEPRGELCAICSCEQGASLVRLLKERVAASEAMRAECPTLPTDDCPPCPRTRARCRYAHCEIERFDAIKAN